MALKIKNITDLYNMQVFTDTGDYFGDVEEAVLTNNKVSGWRIRATRESFLSRILGGAKGVIVPHQLVKAVGDIMLISKSAVPSYEEEEPEE
ncbi:photosystem reaction center subunit H [archaeon]|nr:photosystem reaction center subunit H [archaeon]|tara:strand:+ start:330 stop:605 length:276 start_codon:yes stop_codon:yes gene_type:complete